MTEEELTALSISSANALVTEHAALLTEALAQQAAKRQKLGVSLEVELDRAGAPRYVVTCSNGQHKSSASYAAALEGLVDSHRTRIEDLPETHERLRAVFGDIHAARRTAYDLGRQVLAANPDMPGEQRDALVLVEVSRLEAEKVTRDAQTAEREAQAAAARAEAERLAAEREAAEAETARIEAERIAAADAARAASIARLEQLIVEANEAAARLEAAEAGGTR